MCVRKRAFFSPLLGVGKRRCPLLWHEAPDSRTRRHHRPSRGGASRLCLRAVERPRSSRDRLRAAGSRGALPVDRGVGCRSDLGRPDAAARLGLHEHDARPRRHAACSLRGSQGRRRPVTPALAASDGSARACPRGVPPSTLGRAPERSEGRVPCDSPLPGGRPTARRLARSRKRSAPLCARRAPAHGYALSYLPRPPMQAAPLEDANLAVRAAMSSNSKTAHRRFTRRLFRTGSSVTRSRLAAVQRSFSRSLAPAHLLQST